ncbi:MAG TPA: ABC transporter substrate-binding protein [Candidatus Paceibacterota bacterium]
MKKTVWTVIAVIVIILIAVLAQKPSKEAATGPVRLGGAFMITGPAAPVGELQQKGASLAVETINNAGGINGRPIEIVIEDAGYDPKTAVSAYQALKIKGLKLFIMDGSSVVSATHQLVVDDGNFTIAGGATAPSYFDNSIQSCRIALTAKDFAPGMAEILRKHDYKNVAVFLADNEYGRGLASEFVKAFNGKDESIVVTEFYSGSAGSSDFRTNILKIKAQQDKIDAIVFSNILTNAEGMLRQMKELGVNKPIVSDNPTFENPSIKDFSLLEGTEVVDYEYTRAIQPTDSAKVKGFKEAYRAKYGIDPQYFGAGTYDSIMLVAEAVGKVGEDPKAVAKYISSLKNYEGVTGTYTFDNDCEVDRTLITRGIKNGVKVDIK